MEMVTAGNNIPKGRGVMGRGWCYPNLETGRRNPAELGFRGEARLLKANTLVRVWMNVLVSKQSILSERTLIVSRGD